MDYPIRRRVPWGGRKVLHALDAVDLEIAAGEALGIVGESGGGKSTQARLIARLSDPSAGEIELEGENILRLPATKFARSPLRRDIQMVFQDPTESLAPHLTAFQLIADPVRRLLSPDTVELTRLVHESAVAVDLPMALLDRYPHQLSEGQKARVGLARAIAPQPRLLVLDEPTSALDVSVQATVLTTLDRLRRERGIAMPFISHDPSVVRLMCQRVAVMYLGQIVEEGPTGPVYRTPQHPYTRALLSAAPSLHRRAHPVSLDGEPQSPIGPLPAGCRLAGRCPVE